MTAGIASRPLMAAIFILIRLCAGCSVFPETVPESGLPPVLAQDELIRPYTKIGRIQVVREVYGSELWYDANLQEWGVKVLRFEAYKLGADAVILPEVTSRAKTVVIFPTFPATEYKATGVAIKFK